MKVRELIDKLSKLDPEAQVFGYSALDEGDFPVRGVYEAGPDDRHYVKGDSYIPEDLESWVYLEGGG